MAQISLDLCFFEYFYTTKTGKVDGSIPFGQWYVVCQKNAKLWLTA